jgi:diguanylate cyclase (GGDEF)-like protein
MLQRNGVLLWTAVRQEGGERVRSGVNWVRRRLGAEGLPIKWRIFGIAIIGGALTTLVMVLALWSIQRVEHAAAEDAQIATTLNQISQAQTTFVTVRTQLFRLATQPDLGSGPVEQATLALGSATAALDPNTLPVDKRPNISALKVGLVTFSQSARDLAEKLGPGFAGPLELADYDKQTAPIEGLFSGATRDADDALNASRHDGRGLLRTVRVVVVLATLSALALLLAMSLRLTLKIVREFASLAEMTDEVRRGNLVARSGIQGNDEIGMLARGLDKMAESIEASAEQREGDRRREFFRSSLIDAFEMVDNEYAAARVVERAFTDLVPELPAEVLLADSSRAHLRRAAKNPQAGAPGCQVGTPFDCPAVRRSQTLVFESSTKLNACPVLVEREGGPCSAVCTPVSFMGEALGVVHVVAEDGEAPEDAVVKQLELLASQTGARIGTLRAFTQTHLQATTDGLTGILNRRSFEDAARQYLVEGTGFALVMGDLDHFKELNDTYGHETGDRALRLFARILKESARGDDIVARFGGEEFVLALARTSEQDGIKMLERMQFALGASIAQASVPVFTASFGIACTDDAAMTLEDVLRSADAALYAAKAAGRNRIVAASQIPDTEFDERAIADAVGAL